LSFYGTKYDTIKSMSVFELRVCHREMTVPQGLLKMSALSKILEHYATQPETLNNYIACFRLKFDFFRTESIQARRTCNRHRPPVVTKCYAPTRM